MAVFINTPSILLQKQIAAAASILQDDRLHKTISSNTQSGYIVSFLPLMDRGVPNSSNNKVCPQATIDCMH